MSKQEYLEEKRILDNQINDTTADIENIEKELMKVPTENDLENLEQIASKIIDGLGNNLDISPQDKRRVMDMLNLKVFISLEGKIKLEGWFMPESDGLLSTSIRWIGKRKNVSNQKE